MPHAYVTIFGNVFVDRDEMEQRLKEKFPELKSEEDAAMDLATYEQETEVFQELAKEKMDELFKSDTPVKKRDVDLVMHTYQRR